MSWATSPGRRRIMQGNRSRDTRPELAVRRAAHALGLRYRVAARPIAGLRRTADLLFTRARVAVYVDGCFWHSCPIHTPSPRENVDYWRDKLLANSRRDADTDRILAEAGWEVLHFWEHDDPVAAAQQIHDVVAERRLPRRDGPRAR